MTHCELPREVPDSASGAACSPGAIALPASSAPRRIATSGGVPARPSTSQSPRRAAEALLVLVAATSPVGCSSCVIQGVDSGVCRSPADFAADMPFCAPFVRYSACVPREVPWLSNFTVTSKDQWAQTTYEGVLATRLAAESSGGEWR
jgi:hypothetical protein